MPDWLPDWLYETGPAGPWSFVVVTLLLGGAAAFVSGRAIALTWRSLLNVPAYMVLLAAAVRFVQFAVFATPLLSARSYLIDLVILLVVASAGYRITRHGQMATQYGWLQQK